eukprot:scaffold10139_cov80-Attheya_sp.AAC.1
MKGNSILKLVAEVLVLDGVTEEVNMVVRKRIFCVADLKYQKLAVCALGGSPDGDLALTEPNEYKNYLETNEYRATRTAELTNERTQRRTEHYGVNDMLPIPVPGTPV